MIYVDDLAKFPEDKRSTVVTIGKFDGLHFGHLELLRLVREQAAERNLTSVAVTFDRNPMQLFRPDVCPSDIVSLDQKVELLSKQAIDAVVVLKFDEEMAAREPLDFVREVLVRDLGAKVLIVGQDFRFGHKGAGDVEFLREHAEEYGYELIVPEDLIGDGERRASSTWVRQALAVGNIDMVNELLQRHHKISGIVNHGAKRGRELGFPTANLDPATIEGLIPGDGVYAGWCTIDGVRYPAAISVGNNPTFDGVPQQQVEAHLIDVTLDLYGKRMEVEFVKHLRGMVKFNGLDELIARITADVDRARELLAAEDAELTHARN